MLMRKKVSLEKRFKAVANKYQDFKQEQILIEEEHPVFYLYEIQSKGQTFTGIIAGTSVKDYQNNVIKNTKIRCNTGWNCSKITCIKPISIQNLF